MSVTATCIIRKHVEAWPLWSPLPNPQQQQQQHQQQSEYLVMSKLKLCSFNLPTTKPLQ